MPATDLVPCFYTGQDFRWEQPAEFRLRSELHRIKKLKIGRFDQDGRIFLFARRIEAAARDIFSVPVSAKTVLTFLKTRTDGAKLHYEMPPAGYSYWHNRFERPYISVSSRSLFNHQVLPMAVSA
jgi:hypothetical protein